MSSTCCTREWKSGGLWADTGQQCYLQLQYWVWALWTWNCTVYWWIFVEFWSTNLHRWGIDALVTILVQCISACSIGKVWKRILQRRKQVNQNNHKNLTALVFINKSDYSQATNSSYNRLQPCRHVVYLLTLRMEKWRSLGRHWAVLLLTVVMLGSSLMDVKLESVLRVISGV